MPPTNIEPKSAACKQSIDAVRDTLYVLSGKWKLPILIALINGRKRFKDLQRELEDITPKVLSKELKELELNEFVTRTVYATSPVTVEYEFILSSSRFRASALLVAVPVSFPKSAAAKLSIPISIVFR
jgi:DNA-binding HxlR family transcriptional regulator